MKRVLPVLTAFAMLSLLCSFNRPAHAGASSSTVNQDPAPPTSQIDLEPVLAGLDQPLFVTGAGDGSHRLFIVERPGRIKVLLPNATVPTLFLDITDRVGSGGERGM